MRAIAAAPFVTDLVWLKHEIARAFPDATDQCNIVRLADARRTNLAPDSRFDLAYNAAHALSLAALRKAGYRSDKRYTVFQTLPHTLGVKPEHRHKGLDSLLVLQMQLESGKYHMARGESSWILENNLPMRAAIEKLGGRLYKTYRVYQKPLVSSS